MEFKLRPARRGALYCRALLFSESGHGKTYSALAVAIHLADLYGYSPNDIVVLDTETVENADNADDGTGSAEKYAGRPCNCNRCLRQGLIIDGFQTMIMEEGSRGPEEFCRALQVCKKAGVKIVIADGITPEWRALLQLVDRVKAQSNGREDGWSTARPLHNQFVTALMKYPGHVIATCRAKKESRHKKAEQGLGDVMPDQDSNVIYDYDVAVFLKKGTGHIVKTRDDRLENVSSRHPGADLAEGLKRWCDDPRATKLSAVGEHAATAPRSVPDVAPNTRTDVRDGAGKTDEACLATTIDVVEVRIDTLKSLFLHDLAEKSEVYLTANRERGRGLLQLIQSQDKAIAAELQRVAAEEEAERQSMQETERTEEGAQDPTEGFSDLPF